MSKLIHTSGKRRTARARVTMKDGKGKVKINQRVIEHYEPRLARMKIQEPLLLAGKLAKKVDINANVEGGGANSQAEAVRLGIARAFVAYAPELKEVFLNYDRHLLIADVRRKETRKPNSHGKARAKKQKSYR